MEERDFAWAMRKLRNAEHLTRSGWNGKNMWIYIQMPDDHSKMTEPYIYMKTADSKIVPWVASQTDLLASDWNLSNVF